MLRQMKKEWSQRQSEEYRSIKHKILGGVFLGVCAIGAVVYLVREEENNNNNSLHDDMDIAWESGRRLLGFPAANGEKTFSKGDLRNGAVILHLMGMCYMFLAIAIICDEFFVPAIDVIVEKLKLSPDAAGATFMAAGGSAPELFTSFIGVWITKDDVGIGTIVGSAVFNVLFVIGCCAIFSLAPLKLTWWPFFRDCSYYCMSLLVLAAFFNLSSANKIQWWEALCLFFLYFGYVALMFNNEAVFQFVNTKVLKKESKVLVDGEEVEDVSQMQVAKPLQFTVSVFNLMTADADISQLAGIHIVARMKGDAKTTFNSLDTDSNGFIDRNEFAQCLKRLGQHVTQAEVDACFDQIDENKSNTIDFDEFSKWYVTSQWKIKQDVEHIFKKFDHNNDGHIDTGEIFALLKAVNPDDTPTDEAVEEAKQLLDTNKDGHVSLQEFLKWWESSLFFQNERKRRATIADAEEKQHEEGDGLSLAFPENTPGRIMYIISVPIIVPLYYTVPDVRRSEWWAQWYPITLLMSMVWLAIYSTLMVFFANVFGDVCNIPPAVMGLTLLAAGTSVPDLLTSVIVARAGHGDMAVSSSIGSNIFDILVGLPVPWLTYCIGRGKAVEVNSDGIALSILILFGMIASVLGIIIWQNWIMTDFLGYAMFGLYVIFVIQDLLRSYKVF